MKRGLIIIITVLLVISLGCGGLGVYERYFSTSNGTKEEPKKETPEEPKPIVDLVNKLEDSEHTGNIIHYSNETIIEDKTADYSYKTEAESDEFSFYIDSEGYFAVKKVKDISKDKLKVSSIIQTSGEDGPRDLVVLTPNNDIYSVEVEFDYDTDEINMVYTKLDTKEKIVGISKVRMYAMFDTLAVKTESGKEYTLDIKYDDECFEEDFDEEGYDECLEKSGKDETIYTPLEEAFEGYTIFTYLNLGVNYDMNIGLLEYAYAQSIKSFITDDASNKLVIKEMYVNKASSTKQKYTKPGYYDEKPQSFQIDNIYLVSEDDYLYSFTNKDIKVAKNYTVSKVSNGKIVSIDTEKTNKENEYSKITFTFDNNERITIDK